MEQLESFVFMHWELAHKFERVANAKLRAQSDESLENYPGTIADIVQDIRRYGLTALCPQCGKCTTELEVDAKRNLMFVHENNLQKHDSEARQLEIIPRSALDEQGWLCVAAPMTEAHYSPLKSPEIHKALSDPMRFKMYDILQRSTQPLSVNELWTRIGRRCNPGHAARQLKILLNAGLLISYKVGRERLYACNKSPVATVSQVG
ncbi:MAG: winged helix-turn-helix transcriptional regulator [Candidatus Peregrinibacteria bacterium]|nr:winged helix-turn-helix transcriptional regulator [Candidatus Peregrinibacteria bacterium]MCB9807833.1 winged helix-turn-helix transcriptional regulator [Candidatus Peribacteria bacterium]